MTCVADGDRRKRWMLLGPRENRSEVNREGGRKAEGSGVDSQWGGGAAPTSGASLNLSPSAQPLLCAGDSFGRQSRALCRVGQLHSQVPQ